MEPDKTGAYVDHLLHHGLQNSRNAKEKRYEDGVSRVKKKA
jgi:hypothetical protein